MGRMATSRLLAFAAKVNEPNGPNALRHDKRLSNPQVGQANKGAVTHAGAAEWPWFDR